MDIFVKFCIKNTASEMAPFFNATKNYPIYNN